MPENERFFTDAEHRILLSALSREREVCRKMDEESTEGGTRLVPIVDGIERKVNGLQHRPKPACWIQKDGNRRECPRCGVVSMIAMYPTGRSDYCPNCGERLHEPEEREKHENA